MNIYTMRKRNLPKLDYRLANGSTSVCYRAKKDGEALVFKEFILNKDYARVIEFHNNHFLEYLMELAKIENDFLVTPEDIYLLRRHLVGAYDYPYQAGNTLDRLYPKTNVDILIDALDEFDKKLRNFDELKLGDMHYKNMIYTGDIKLIDLDLGSFNTSNDTIRENIAHVNNWIIRALFKIDMICNYEFFNPLKEVGDSVLSGETKVSDLLREYKEMLISRYGKCNYIKNLKKDFIVEVPKRFKS